MDLVGHLLRLSGSSSFKGKGRLLNYWLRHRRPGDIRKREFAPGVSMRCDLSTPYEAIVWLGQEESSDLEVLRALLRKGDVFVDCGANMGLWTVTAAIAVGAAGKVHAFEPNEIPRAKLESTLREARIGNVVLHAAAVGDRAGIGFLALESQHNVCHMVPARQPGSFEVAVVALDDELDDRPVAGCKIDVEGAEFEVLCGAARMIDRQRPWICVEFNTLIDRNSRLGDWKVHALLSGWGYQPYLGKALLERKRTECLRDEDRFTGYRNIFYIHSDTRAKVFW